jgi:hypothetical protein
MVSYRDNLSVSRAFFRAPLHRLTVHRPAREAILATTLPVRVWLNKTGTMILWTRRRAPPNVGFQCPLRALKLDRVMALTSIGWRQCSPEFKVILSFKGFSTPGQHQ